jgi:hypothetical protein
MDDSKVGKFDQMVRPLVTLGMLVIFGWLAITAKISSDASLGLIGMVFGFWFQSRSPGAGSASTKTVETDPSGTKREVTMTAPPGAPAPAPAIPEPPKGATP